MQERYIPGIYIEWWGAQGFPTLEVDFPFRSALQSLPPLSISPHSPLKPEFLSPFIVKEMDSFLTTLW